MPPSACQDSSWPGRPATPLLYGWSQFQTICPVHLTLSVEPGAGSLGRHIPAQHTGQWRDARRQVLSSCISLASAQLCPQASLLRREMETQGQLVLSSGGKGTASGPLEALPSWAWPCRKPWGSTVCSRSAQKRGRRGQQPEESAFLHSPLPGDARCWAKGTLDGCDEHP